MRRWVVLVFALFLIASSFHGFALAQTTGGLGINPTVFVAPLDESSPTNDALRRRLIEQLKKSGHVRVVDDANAAEAVLHAKAVIWPTGTIAANPRSNSVKVTNYQGYLSAELLDRSNETLWSYLVTPSRFRMASIVNDLADRLSSKLIEAVTNGIPNASSPALAKNGAGIALRAAGATFPAPLYRKWFESFRQNPGGFPIAYDAVGSVAGIEQLAAGKIDLAASDILPAAMTDTSHLDALQFATVVGGVVPIYNLPDPGRPLHLTPQLLADIYAGKIRRWNDPRIRQWNQGARLPDEEISSVHRSDGSGTTYVWTSYLAGAHSEWNIKPAPNIDWPVGTGASGNEGVAEQVEKMPDSIGYVELTYAIQHQLKYAAVRNPAGRFIRADLASITAAAAHASGAGQRPGLFVLSPDAKDAYPITTFTWFLVPKANSDQQKRLALAGFLHWMLTAGQEQCSGLGYAPLPREVVTEELRAVDALK